MSDEPVDEARYVFCVVDPTGGSGDEQTGADAAATSEGASDEAARLSVEGIDGESPYLVRAGGVAAVVQPCDGPYESERFDQLRRWLLGHQRVVDAAGRAYGTPLPFRFDTVVRGDDDAVREWLEEASDRFAPALSALDGRWEYRVEVGFDLADLAAAVEDDEQLRELAEKRDDAGEGRAYLLEKKYDQRKKALVADRLRRHRERLTDRLAELAVAVQQVEQNASVQQLADDETGGTDEADEPRGGNGDADAEGESSTADTESVSLSVLADESAESAIGELLENVADETGASVRFTGPWPPYTYAPAYLEGTGGGEDVPGDVPAEEGDEGDAVGGGDAVAGTGSARDGGEGEDRGTGTERAAEVDRDG